MKAIAAVDKNLAIGRGNRLIFHLPGDLAHFKAATLGGVVIMGRKTLESMPGGKPLPGRHTLVLSRTMKKGVREIVKNEKKRFWAVVRSPEELFEFLDSIKDDKRLLSFYADCGGPQGTQAAESTASCDPMDAMELSPLENISVCGGEEIYNLMLPYCDELVLTEVEAEAADADAFFPDFKSSGQWEELTRTEPVEENGLIYTICTYRRKLTR